MFAKLNHVAILSDKYAQQGLFYRALFDLKSGSPPQQDIIAWSIGDEYVGMNINPRSAGRQGGLDHFGIQVQDIDTVKERVAKKWPEIEIIQRNGRRRAYATGCSPLSNSSIRKRSASNARTWILAFTLSMICELMD